MIEGGEGKGQDEGKEAGGSIQVVSSYFVIFRLLSQHGRR